MGDGKPGPQVVESQIGSESPGHCPSRPLCIFLHKLLWDPNWHLVPSLLSQRKRHSPLGPEEEATLSLFCLGGQTEGYMPSRSEETPGMGKAALANVFTRLWHSTALPGCRASSLHQQIVSIPSLQELPRAPRKGEKQMGSPHPGHCSPWRVLPKQAHGTP